MSGLPKNSKTDDIESLLEKWGEQLPDPPPSLIDSSLDKLQRGQNLKPQTRPTRLVLLGGMVAIIGLIVAGVILLLIRNGNSNSQNTKIASIPTVTSTVDNVIPTATLLPTNPSTAPEIAHTPTIGLTPDTTTLAAPFPASQITTASTQNATASTATPGATETDVSALPIVTIEQSTGTVPNDLPNPRVSGKPTLAPPPTASHQIVPAPIKSPPVITPATSTVTASSDNNQTFTGAIKYVDLNSITLNTEQKIIITPITKILVKGQALPGTKLVIGQYVVVQAHQDVQGQIVADTINILPRAPLSANPAPAP